MRLGPRFLDSEPELTDSGRSLAEFGPNSAETRPNPAQIEVWLGQQARARLNSISFGPNSVSTVPGSAKFARFRLELDRFGQMSACVPSVRSLCSGTLLAQCSVVSRWAGEQHIRIRCNRLPMYGLQGAAGETNGTADTLTQGIIQGIPPKVHSCKCFAGHLNADVLVHVIRPCGSVSDDPVYGRSRCRDEPPSLRAAASRGGKVSWHLGAEPETHELPSSSSCSPRPANMLHVHSPEATVAEWSVGDHLSDHLSDHLRPPRERPRGDPPPCASSQPRLRPWGSTRRHPRATKPRLRPRVRQRGGTASDGNGVLGTRLGDPLWRGLLPASLIAVPPSALR